MGIYQEDQSGIELKVFVELTNNANNRAVSFYESYNPAKRVYILGNFCELPDTSNDTNEILKLDNNVRGVLYHETSHLFITKLLNKHIGDLNQYKSICENCNTIQSMNKVDHMIVYPNTSCHDEKI